MWHRIDRELEARRARHRVPSSWADIARALSTTEQRVNNWKRRRIPAAQYAPLAAIFGWSVDQLLGLAEGSDRPGPAAPPPDFHDRHVATPSEWALLQDMKDAMEVPMLARKLEELRAEVAELKAFSERHRRRAEEFAEAAARRTTEQGKGQVRGMSVLGELDDVPDTSGTGKKARR